MNWSHHICDSEVHVNNDYCGELARIGRVDQLHYTESSLSINRKVQVN